MSLTQPTPSTRMCKTLDIHCHRRFCSDSKRIPTKSRHHGAESPGASPVASLHMVLPLYARHASRLSRRRLTANIIFFRLLGSWYAARAKIKSETCLRGFSYEPCQRDDRQEVEGENLTTHKNDEPIDSTLALASGPGHICRTCAAGVQPAPVEQKLASASAVSSM